VVEPGLEDLQQVGRALWEADLISSHGGNLSLRLADGTVMVTRHGCMLGRIREEDLVRIAPGAAAPAEASLDTAVHRAVYESQPKARAIVHAHPRHAIALSLLDSAIEPRDLEGQYYLKRIGVVQPQEIPQALAEQVIVVAQGHGSYAWGEDPWQALQWTSVLEESAQVLWLLRCLGR
jgi:L-fuculose-phosphate aldolase